MAQTLVQIVNPDMEGVFLPFNGVGELKVPNGWRPRWIEGVDGLRRPEYTRETKDIGRGRVYSGDSAAKWFGTFSKVDGALYQIVPATPDKWYLLSAMVYVWSSQQDNPDISSDNGKATAIVGINPWGDEDIFRRTTIWGKETLGYESPYNTWRQIHVRAQAWSNHITLVLRGAAEYAVKHNDWYWDAVILTELDYNDDVPDEPEPGPTLDVDYDRIRAIVSEELGKLRLTNG